LWDAVIKCCQFFIATRKNPAVDLIELIEENQFFCLAFLKSHFWHEKGDSKIRNCHF